MTHLVAVIHPLTGETLHLHPDIAAQKHHWIHPDPCVPTPAESLPLFDLHEVDLLAASLAQLDSHSTSTPDLVLSGATDGQ